MQVARSQAENARVEHGHLLGLAGGELGVRRLAVARVRVFHRLRHRGPHLADDGQIHRQRLIRTLQHRHRLLPLQQTGDQVGRERPEHRQVEDADLEAPAVTQVIGDGLGVPHQRALPQNHVFGVIEPVARGTRIAAAGEGVELLHRLVGQLRQVVEEERPLGRDALGVAVLVLYHSDHGGVVEIEHLGNPAPLITEHHALSGSRRFDDIRGVPEVFLDQLALRKHDRLDYVAGEEAVLSANAGVQRQLGDPVRDQIEVGDLLNVLCEELEESRVVDRMIIVVPRVHVQRVLGHRPASDVEHIRQPLTHGRVERLVHVGDALATREVGGAQTRHAHPGGDGRGRVLALGLEEDELPAVHVQHPGCHGGCPTLTHLGRWGDRIGTGTFACRGLHRHDGLAPVHRHTGAGILGRHRFRFLSPQFHATSLRAGWGVSTNC